MRDGSERYVRQLAMAAVGASGQVALARSRVTVVGAGGLGSPCLMYLAAAGVGHIQVVDGGSVELSNLNRQILYDEGDLGLPKAPLAARRLRALNSEVAVEPVEQPIPASSEAIARFGPSVIVDCLDTLEARVELNTIARSLAVPLVSAAVAGEAGHLAVAYPDGGPCLACVFAGKTGVRAPVPVIGYAPGTLGALEAALTIQVILGGRPLESKLVIIDLASWTFDTVRTERRPDCPVCDNHGTARQ